MSFSFIFTLLQTETPQMPRSLVATSWRPGRNPIGLGASTIESYPPIGAIPLGETLTGAPTSRRRVRLIFSCLLGCGLPQAPNPAGQEEETESLWKRGRKARRWIW